MKMDSVAYVIIILAFLAYLMALFSLSREKSLKHSFPQATSKPKNSENKSESPPPIDNQKLFKHTLFIKNLEKAQPILKQLQKKKLRYTMEGNEDGSIIICYASPTKSNIKKLKEKGLIISGKIEDENDEILLEF